MCGKIIFTRGQRNFKVFRRFEMIRRILCPTDLTERSREGVAYALRLAKENGAQLIVFHAASFPAIGWFACELEPYRRWEELVCKFKLEQLLAAAEHRVKHFVAREFSAELGDVAWKPAAALGKAPEVIVATALQEDVELIVMARHQRAPLARLFTMSVWEAVSRIAPCPVLSIDTTPFQRPSRGGRLPLLREIFQGY